MPLDYEKKRTYSLKLRATDGQNVMMAPVTITILDVFSFVSPTNANPIIQSKGAITMEKMEIVNVSQLIPGTFQLRWLEDQNQFQSLMPQFSE